jgi:redox-sensitive bicupin YhaK (pirin superfamily)
MWDIRPNRDAALPLGLPDRHTAMLVVLSGRITVNGIQQVGESEMVLLSRNGSDVNIPLWE